jgi:hypothetical protein
MRVEKHTAEADERLAFLRELYEEGVVEPCEPLRPLEEPIGFGVRVEILVAKDAAVRGAPARRVQRRDA